jgi:two-component system cell cycle sensor histidine kinase/response regulator CckA
VTIDRSILVVDDDADIREVTTLALESYGYRVLSASDGEQALRVVRLEPTVSVVLLDLMMPIMDGPSLVKVLRADGPLSTIAVVVLSGDSAARQRAADIGADACLLKPVDLSSLLDTVRRFIDGRPEARLDGTTQS